MIEGALQSLHLSGLVWCGVVDTEAAKYLFRTLFFFVRCSQSHEVVHAFFWVTPRSQFVVLAPSERNT